MIKISFTWNQPDSRRRRRCVPIPQLIAIASLQATSERRGDHSQGGTGPWEGASGRDPHGELMQSCREPMRGLHTGAPRTRSAQECLEAFWGLEAACSAGQTAFN